MRKPKGLRARTRSLLRKNSRDRGKISTSRLLYDYKQGEKVVIDIEPSVHKGMPHRRYQGRVGVVVGKRGRAYAVNVTQGDAVKEIIVLPEHLKPHAGG
ncbi:MAG: 50S ribosomal protein L21e [Candidatus Bathyarchaeia archaeon]